MAFVIPTTYTAVDRFSVVANRIAQASMNMAQRMEVSAARSQQAMMNILPNDDALKRGFEFMISMGKAMAVAGTSLFASKTIMDYEKELANLKALTGATGEEFLKFKDIIQQTAIANKKNAVEVAQAFTTIGNAMPALLEDAQGLGVMTDATIRLSKAANMELQPAAEALTAILNQFAKGAESANSAIEAMASGSKYGSAEIEHLQGSLLAFGAVANQVAGISLNQSIALTELVSSYKKGADAGTELRNVLLEMGKGFAQDEQALKDMMRLGINVKMVADKTVPFNLRLQEMSKALKDGNAMLHIFGKENEAMALTLLRQAGAFDEMTAKVGEMGNVNRMAAENTSTLYAKWNEFTGTFANFIVDSGKVNWGLNVLKSTLSFVTENMGGLLNIITTVGMALAIMKLRIVALAVAAKGLIFWQTALSAVTRGYIYVLFTYQSAVFAGTAATLAFNVATGGLLLALGAIVAVFGESFDASANYTDQIEKLANGFDVIKKKTTIAEIGQKKYNEALSEYAELQNFIEFQNWADRQGFVTGLSSRIKGALMHPLYTITADKERQTPGYFAPKMEDYMTPEEIKSFDPAYTPRNSNTTTTQVIHHKVELNQGGKYLGTFDTSSAMPNLSSTTR